MRKTIALTIDIEHDCPPYLRTYKGIESGLSGLLEALEEYDVQATFFVTGDVASKYPWKIKEIAQHHEIGCHGYSHRRFDKMTQRDAANEIEKSTRILCRITDQESIASFRAPNLMFPERFLGILKDNGYMIDSSLAKYKIGYLYRMHTSGNKDATDDLLRIPVSATSSLLRMPLGNKIIMRLSQPVILFFHPWEFVEMQNEPIRWDCRINTGQKALGNLESLIKSMKDNNYRFCTMSGFLSR